MNYKKFGDFFHSRKILVKKKRKDVLSIMAERVDLFKLQEKEIFIFQKVQRSSDYIVNPEEYTMLNYVVY